MKNPRAKSFLVDTRTSPSFRGWFGVMVSREMQEGMRRKMRNLLIIDPLVEFMVNFLYEECNGCGLTVLIYCSLREEKDDKDTILIYKIKRR